MINLLDLTHQEFEVLVGLLLNRNGHEIVRGPEMSGIRGPDFETTSPDGRKVVVEVKHFKRPVGSSMVGQFLGDLERYRLQDASTKGLFVLSNELSNDALSLLNQKKDVDVWDATTIQSMLSAQPDVIGVFESLQSTKLTFASQVWSLMASPKRRAEELCSGLHAVPCGKGDWKSYENLCTEILTYVFTPELAAPDIQSRSDDGLDIIDAIFAIRSHSPPWSVARAEYKSRFVVAEFKNYCDPIDQKQVESIAQYLWSKAHRTFGLLVSRKKPSDSAVKQRRRQWLDAEKMIVMLTDEDLCEMLQLKESGGQPFDVIDAQLEDFLRTLNP